MDYASWKYVDASFLPGRAVDRAAYEVQNWADDIYKDLKTAQLACVALGDGCGGVTGHHESNSYSVRRSATFRTIRNHPFSYLKPDNPCGRCI